MDVTLLDGGVGQELLARSGDAPTPLWATQVMRDHPGLLASVHRSFLDAGSGIVTLNSYALHRDRLESAGIGALFTRLHAQALAEAEAARAAAGRGRLALSLGPLVTSYRPETFPPLAEAVPAYAEIVALHDGRVDLVIAETVASLAHAEGVLAGVRAAAPGVEAWLAVTVDDDDGTRLRSGEPLAVLAPVIARHRPAAVLVNCSASAAVAQAMAPLAALGLPFGGYANGFARPTGAFLRDAGAAGTPVVDRQRPQPAIAPSEYARHALGWVERGASIVGGCCNIGPAHIAEVAAALRAAGHRIL
ncbi:MAG: homocysteine S-methyltransferase family protein [Rhodobacteraceae bacterium]|jgi:homocysteine S-methyltransferase|nr:homocysteine S-methyltransferase family protein [Paracoccaceae bacterium]